MTKQYKVTQFCHAHLYRVITVEADNLEEARLKLADKQHESERIKTYTIQEIVGQGLLQEVPTTKETDND